MTGAELKSADAAAYQLRALIRTIETRARDQITGSVPVGVGSALNDIALLCELAGNLARQVHHALDELEPEEIK